MPSDITSQNPMISQVLLANLLEQRRIADEARRQVEILRERILELDDSGARVEPGLLELKITRTEKTNFSREKLVAVMSEAMVADIEEQLPKTAYRRVDVSTGRAKPLRSYEDCGPNWGRMPWEMGG